MNTQQHRQTPSDMVQFATFFLGDELFGVNALHVQEILLPQDLTLVPLAPEYVKGLMNIRGQIVTVIDVRCRLGFAPLEDEHAGMHLLVNSSEGLMSLFVDEIGNVLDIPGDRLFPAPGTIRGVAADYIQDVCQLEDDLLIVINLEKMLQLT